MNSTKTGVRAQLGPHLETMTVTVPIAAALMYGSDRLVARVRRNGNEVGASTLEWVVISAIIVTIVLAVGATLYTRLTDKATDLDLTTP